MIKRLLLFVVLVASIGYGQVFEWAKHIYSEDNSSESISVDLDSDGGVYSFGYFKENQDFDPSDDMFILTAPDSEESGFIQKLDNDGNFEWAVQIDNDDLILSDLTISSENNIYILGNFKGVIDLDPSDDEFILDSGPSRYDIFLMCLDESGEFLWGQAIGELANNDISRDIVIDQDDNMYISASFADIPAFIKFNDSGDELWRYESEMANFNAYHLAVNSDNNLIATGTFIEDTIDIDFSDEVFEIYGYPGVSSANFIMNLDSDGDFLWAVSIGGEGSLLLYSIAIDQSDNIYLAGGFSDGDIDVDPSDGTEIISAGVQKDYFVLKLNQTGGFEWVGTYGGAADDYAYGLDVDNENLYITGEFNGSADFDGGDSEFIMTSNGGRDVFIQVLDLNGTFQWAQQIGNSQTDIGYDIMVDEDGSIYTVGKFQNEVDFDPSESEFILESLEGVDAFIQKLNTSLGVLEYKQGPSLVVYPNPSSELLNIAVTGKDLLIMKMYDVHGQLVMSRLLNDESQTVDMQSFANGVYTIVISDNEGGVSSHKIVKN